MRPLRVLVVDDSVVVRRMVTDALAADPGVEVVGTAANGKIALSKLSQVKPDAVTLDIEMPIMDGLETLVELRKTHPKLPVVMFSTLTERGAKATLDALSLGASDYVTKPSNTGSVTVALQRISDELIPKLRALCPGFGSATPLARPVPGSAGGATAPAPSAPVKVRAPRTTSPGRVDLVAIGISTGGPNALAELLPRLPSSFPVPVVIVQHMPPLFTKLLAERLDGKCSLSVREATSNALLSPGTVWVAPGDQHMLVERQGAGAGRIRLTSSPQENSCRPAVDPLFRSVAATYGPNALGVIMTGMGQDGLRGSEEVIAAGGSIVTQDEASSVVWGMPGFVVRAGLADAVVDLQGLAAEITKRVDTARRPAGAGAAAAVR